QAEDGIRDFHVTGVQTCALPITTIIPLHRFQYSMDVPVKDKHHAPVGRKISAQQAVTDRLYCAGANLRVVRCSGGATGRSRSRLNGRALSCRDAGQPPTSDAALATAAHSLFCHA